MRRHGEWPLHLGRHLHERRAALGHARRVRASTRPPGWALTRPPRRRTSKSRRCQRLLVDAGLNAEAFPDLLPAQWSKLIFNATVNTVAAMTGLRHVALFAREEAPSDLGHLVHELMDEGKAVAAAAGIVLHEDPWEMNVLRRKRGETQKSDYAHVPSMLEDVARPPDRGRSHHGRARPRGRAARRARSAAHRHVSPDQREGGVLHGVRSRRCRVSVGSHSGWRKEHGMTKGRWGALGALLVAAAATAAIAASVGGGATAATTRPIVIGWAYDGVGQMAPFDGPALAAAKIRVAQINLVGGVSGRRIRIDTCNTQNNAPRGRRRAPRPCSAGARTSSSPRATSTSPPRSCRSRSTGAS